MKGRIRKPQRDKSPGVTKSNANAQARVYAICHTRNNQSFLPLPIGPAARGEAPSTYIGLQLNIRSVPKLQVLWVTCSFIIPGEKSGRVIDNMSNVVCVHRLIFAGFSSFRDIVP